MKNIKLLLFVFSVFLYSCQPEYITEFKPVEYIVIDKESHTDLNWVTEAIFDIKTTKVTYDLILQRNGYVTTVSVSQAEYYSHNIGSKYYKYEYVQVKNPKYKKSCEK